MTVPVIPPVIDSLGTPPNTADPDNFDARGDALFGQLPDMVAQINAANSATYQNSVLTVEVLGDCQDVLTSAQQSALEAAASAAAAGLSINVTKWAAGTFTEGQCVWSPTDYQNYRCINAGVRNTDPAADSANWANLSTPAAWKPISASTYAAKPYEKLLVDTTANKVTISLPTVGLVAGKTTVEYIDYARNFSSNAVTFDAGANKIEGLAETMDVTKKGMSGKLLYVDSTKGWLNI